MASSIGSPSTLASTSMETKSPSWAGRSASSTVANCTSIRVIWASRSSSVTFGLETSTLRSLYLGSSMEGQSVTVTSTSTPPATSSMDVSSGVTAGRISSASRTSVRVGGTRSSIASRRTRSAPTVASTTGTGAFPGRKPWILTSLASLRAAPRLAAVICSSVSWNLTMRSNCPDSVTVVVITWLGPCWARSRYT